MAKKQPQEPEKHQLAISREKARALINIQIEKGEAILGTQIKDKATLQSAKEAADSWYDYTKEVLLKSFTTDKMEHEFAWAVRSFGASDQIREFYDHMNLRLSKLKSIYERVELYDNIIVPGVTQVGMNSNSMNRKKVFIIHGRNLDLLNSMLDLLRAIGLDPVEWSCAIKLTGKSTPTIQEIVSAAFQHAQAIIVLLSGDDVVKLRSSFVQPHDGVDDKEITVQARPNVLFEAGMALAGNEGRTVLVQVGKLRKFSDIDGLHITHLDNSAQQKLELVNKLKNAWCDVPDLTENQRWLTIGNFVDEYDCSAEIVIPPERINTNDTTVLQKKAKTMSLALAWSLKERLNSAIEAHEHSLADEYLVEYVKIIDQAIRDFGEVDSLKELRDKRTYYPMTKFIDEPDKKIWWALNAIERLIVIIGSITQ